MSSWTVPALSAPALEAMREVFGQMASAKRFSDEEKDGIYSQCLAYYKQGLLDKAHNFLILLRVYAPMEYRFTLLQAMCFKQQKEFDEALAQLRMAAMVEPDNPEPCLHAAECLMAQGHAQEAEQVLQQVLQLGQGQEKYKRLVERAEGWLALAQQQ